MWNGPAQLIARSSSPCFALRTLQSPSRVRLPRFAWLRSLSHRDASWHVRQLQVYRAVLARNGQVVAVKVQRPGVAEAIALDVFILRWLAAIVRSGAARGLDARSS